MSDFNPEDFANHCTVSAVCDEHGREVKVHVEYSFCTPDGRCHRFDRTIDLDPIIAKVDEVMRNYHARLHGEDPYANPEVMAAGWFDSVVNVAKSVVTSKAVSSIYDQVKNNPVVRGAIGVLPGGGTMLTAMDTADKVVRIAQKAHDTLLRATGGDHQAMAKVAAVKQLANQGHPEAIKVVSIMQTQLTALKAKSAGLPSPLIPTPALSYSANRNHRSLGPDVAYHGRHFYSRGLGREIVGFGFGDIWHGVKKAAEWSPAGIAWKGVRAVAPTAGRAALKAAEWSPAGIAWKGVRAVAPTAGRAALKAAEWSPAGIAWKGVQAATGLPDINQERQQGRSAPSQAFRAAPPPPMPDYDDGGDGSDYADPDSVESGWLYNHPYRGPIEYMMAPSRAPAIAARSLYLAGIRTS